MVETRRSSSSKRVRTSPEPASLPRPNKRSKAKIEGKNAVLEPAGSSSTTELPIENPVSGPVPGSEDAEAGVGSSDPQTTCVPKPVAAGVPVPENNPAVAAEGQDLVKPKAIGEVAVDVERPKAVGAGSGRRKKSGQIFQPLSSSNLASTGLASSLSLLEDQGAPLKGLHIEAREGDPSAVAGVSVLTSLSKFCKSLAICPSTSKPNESAARNKEGPSGPSDCNECSPDVGMNTVDCDKDHGAVSLRDKTVASDMVSCNGNLNADVRGLDWTRVKIKAFLALA